MSQPFRMSSDRKSAVFSITGTKSAVEVSALIADLAVLRAAMEPRLPLNPRDDTSDELAVSEQGDPYLQAKRLRDGRIRLWIRNEGLGWLAFNLPTEKAAALRDYLVANLPAQAGPSLFGDQGGNPDRSGH